MLNIKVTNRMLHEDYVAQATIAPFILPRKHIISVATIAALSALIVLPMPSTWERFNNESSFTADSRDYLSKDQSAEEIIARNETTNLHQENYDDYDIPSQFFESDASKLADSTTLDNIFIDDEDLEDDEELLATTPTTTIEGTWADGNKEATQTAPVVTESPKEIELAQDSKDQKKIELTTEPEPQKEEALAQVPDVPKTIQPEVKQPLEPTDITIPGAAQEPSQIMSKRPEGNWYAQTIQSGDTLSKIFNFLDLPYATLNRITKVAGKRDLLLKVGDPIYFLIDQENVVLEMVKPIGKEEQVRFTRLTATDDFNVVYENINDHVFDKSVLASIPQAITMPLAAEAAKQRAIKEAALAKARAEQEARDRANNVNPNRPRLVISKIEKGENFARAGHRAGLTPSEVKSIGQIFKQKFNINKLKPGDNFRVLFSGIGTNSQLYAIKFETSKGRFESFINPEDQNYYGENEFTPTAGIFRRFPLADEIKVTSHFNPQRRHPVTKRVSPHNGVDFKASVGTPVYAPADGVVTFSGYQRAAGYYVIISHANDFSTVYMHLSKSEVKRGQKVIVGQLIARSGNTGRTTGPHLHYEIRINDRPVNPLKIELPSSNHPNLAREQREAFANNVKVLRADLQNDKLADVKKKK